MRFLLFVFSDCYSLATKLCGGDIVFFPSVRLFTQKGLSFFGVYSLEDA